MFLGSRGGPHPGSSGVMGCPWALYRPSKGSRKKVHRPPAAGGGPVHPKARERRSNGEGWAEAGDRNKRGGDYKE
jgi:hypothetical protein